MNDERNLTPAEPQTGASRSADTVQDVVRAQSGGWRAWGRDLIVAIGVSVFIILFLYQPVRVEGTSMLPMLEDQDRLFINKFAYHFDSIHRGDVVVFLYPHDHTKSYIKRVIALPGDKLSVDHGTVYVNGVAQKEPYAGMPVDDGNPQHAYNPYRDDFPNSPPSPEEQLTEVWRQDLPGHIQNGDLVVPPGKVFAMGDNRTESLDSRYWGFVPEENIEGRPMFVYWSFKTPSDQEDKTSLGDRIGFFVHEFTHFLTQTRWSRTFHVTR
jgi:signal peptidase I